MESGQPNAMHKKAVAFMRDLLVLKVCLGQGPWTNENLYKTFSEVFRRNLEDTLRSQIVLSFNAIVRAGRDRATFDRSFPKN